MEVRILGPVDVSVAGGTLDLGRRQHRLILGILALEPNHLVQCDRLIDLVWGLRPPAHARAAVHSRVSELRAMLNGADSPTREGRLLTRGSGYLFEIVPEHVDAHQFKSLVTQSQNPASLPQLRTALRAALGLWRGPVLGGWLPKDSHDALCQGLEAARVTATEDLFDVELRLGNHRSIVDELQELSSAHPVRERLTVLAMLALYRSGRAAEALRSYERCRRWLDQELGISPGGQLQALHVAILRGEPAPASWREQASLSGPLGENPWPPVVEAIETAQIDGLGHAMIRPETLPVDIPDFTGRESETTRLYQLMTGRDPNAVAVAAIAGPAGVGKTALSVHIAHLLRSEFPDGQLLVNLRGTDDSPATASQVLGRFLRCLGVDGLHVPDSIDDCVVLYQGALAGKRVLVVLDNAANAEQVLPLIPGDPGCAVIINARTRLAALVGAANIDLGPMDGPQAVRLLSRIAGAGRIDPTAGATTDLVRLCGFLPLAIRIAAANLAAKPHWTVERMVARLADERMRLDRFAYGHLNVRSSITLSLTGLSPEALRLLVWLGDIDLPDVNVWASAALLDISPDQADELLEQLHDAQLIDVAGREVNGYSRYRLHDLVRLLARERAAAEAPVELSAGRLRTFGAWLFCAEAAHGQVYGGDYLTIRSPAPRWPVGDDVVTALVADPLQWFDLERQSIVAVVERAARGGCSDISWGLACVTSPLFQMRGDYDLWPGVLTEAYAAADRADDDRGRAAIQYRIGMLCADRRQYEQARKHFQDASVRFHGAGDDHGRAIATAYTAMIDRWQGDHDVALAGYEGALPGLRGHGDHGGEAFALRSIGQLHLERGDNATAETYLGQALTVSRRTGSRRGEAQALFWQGMLRIKQKRYEDAEPLFTHVLELTRTLRDAPGEVQALRGLGLCHLGLGDPDRASVELAEALRLVHQPSLTFLEAQVRQDLTGLPENLREGLISRYDGPST